MDDGLPIVGPDVDLTQAPPINHKRTLAFLNHFVTHTVRFLNHFSGVCEEKLAELQGKIQRLEITLSILEAKLSSIPGLDQVVPTESSTAVSTTTTLNASAAPPEENVPSKTPVQNDDVSMPVEEVKEPEQPKMTVSKDPRYVRYFKMVAMGVPPPAVKGKMQSEGCNPDLLDTPDAPTDSAPQVAADSSDSDSDMDNQNESSSEASFSDDD